MSPPPPDQWDATNGHFALEWDGRPWVLELDHGLPGLHLEIESWSFRLLCLNGLASVGRCEHGIFGPGALVDVERRRSSVLATFRPPGWHDLTVRAAWSPACEGIGVDLEVQATAFSVGWLRRCRGSCE